MIDWAEEHSVIVTVCDRQGKIIAMNAASRRNFAGRGGGKLIGTSLFDCHPEPANQKIRQLLADRTSHIYLSRKKGKNRLIHQSPWFKQGKFMGLVEMIIELPEAVTGNAFRDKNNATFRTP